jgi:hypothetical protein
MTDISSKNLTKNLNHLRIKIVIYLVKIEIEKYKFLQKKYPDYNS